MALKVLAQVVEPRARTSLLFPAGREKAVLRLRGRRCSVGAPRLAQVELDGPGPSLDTEVDLLNSRDGQGHIGSSSTGPTRATGAGCGHPSADRPEGRKTWAEESDAQDLQMDACRWPSRTARWRPTSARRGGHHVG